MVARDLLLVELTGGRYHLQHTSTARSLELIRDGKRRGLAVTCEVTPHHLFLTDEEVAKSGLSTNTKMNPPLRSERDRDALLAGARRRHRWTRSPPTTRRTTSTRSGCRSRWRRSGSSVSRPRSGSASIGWCARA